MDNPMGYNVQVQQSGGYWSTYAYETQYEHAVKCENALKSKNNKTRIYLIKDSSIRGS